MRAFDVSMLSEAPLELLVVNLLTHEAVALALPSACRRGLAWVGVRHVNGRPRNFGLSIQCCELIVDNEAAGDAIGIAVSAVEVVRLLGLGLGVSSPSRCAPRSNGRLCTTGACPHTVGWVGGLQGPAGPRYGDEECSKMAVVPQALLSMSFPVGTTGEVFVESETTKTSVALTISTGDKTLLGAIGVADMSSAEANFQLFTQGVTGVIAINPITMTKALVAVSATGVTDLNTLGAPPLTAE